MSERINYPPRGVFAGRNFMTPDVLAYYKTNKDGQTAYVELSEGTGFLSSKMIYGVTVRQANGQNFENDYSKMFHSKEEAIRYIEDNFPSE